MVKRLIAHLSHVELLTPKFSDSLWFFKDLLGLTVVEKTERSAYLRAWGEFYSPYGVKLTENDSSGLGHVSWRADSEQDMMGLSTSLQKENNPAWTDGDYGHGKALEFKGPDGHKNEVFWEQSKPRVSDDLKSRFRSRSMKIPNSAVPVKRIDHCTVYSSNVSVDKEFYKGIGFKHNEGMFSTKENREISAFMTVTGQCHDLGIIYDMSGAKGRLNHVAYYLENSGTWMQAVDIFTEYGVTVETGPLRHGVTDSLGMYVLEPGGNRVELFNGGYLNFSPRDDWTPIMWNAEEDAKYVWSWGAVPETLFFYGTPPTKDTQFRQSFNPMGQKTAKLI
jgi:catechol 2,3-dioxygenase